MSDFEEKVGALIQQYQEIEPSLLAEALENAKSMMDRDTRREFEDILAVAKARIDKKASIEYWFRDSREGKKIKLTHIQQLILDFIEKAWILGFIPIVNAPMGCGKSSLAVAIIADEIGRNQNMRAQIVCTAEGEATKRGALIARVLLTRDFKKVFPQIEKDKTKPWNAHSINVRRTVIDPEMEELERELGVEPGTIDATMTAYGFDSKALGSRADKTLFDDIPNEDNAINSPTESDKIDSKLDTTWISRRETPIGIKNTDYDLSKDPWRGLFINTPWAETDCVFRRIKKEGYCTILIGVNEDFTGYNVEIWNLPDEMCDELEKRYKLIVDEEILKEDKLKLFERKRHRAGDEIPGYHVYKDFPAKRVFTIPLSRPAEFYLRLYKQNARRFDQMYRCIVVSEREKAFPTFAECLDDKYKVEMIPLEGKNDSGKTIVKGYQGKVVTPMKGAALYASVDLSGAGRAGTVITVCYLLSNYKRFPIDIRAGAWSGDEISDQISKVFKDYPDIITMFVENAGQQDLFIKEVTKHKKEYPWWMKVKPFRTTAKTKKEKDLGVLAMDVAFSNKGFIVANSPGQEGHPTIGDTTFPEGCPCGFCRLIRDCRSQLRLGNVQSDPIMSLWMCHSSMPQIMENPTVGAPEGVLTAENGQDLAKTLEENSTTESFLNILMNGGSVNLQDPQLKRHFRPNGSEITEFDEDWKPEWSDEYEDEEDEEEIEDTTDYNLPQFQRKLKPKINAWKKAF